MADSANVKVMIRHDDDGGGSVVRRTFSASLGITSAYIYRRTVRVAIDTEVAFDTDIGDAFTNTHLILYNYGADLVDLGFSTEVYNWVVDPKAFLFLPYLQQDYIYLHGGVEDDTEVECIVIGDIV